MISVIVCSIIPARFSSIHAQYSQLLAGEPHEIIGIHDARGICEGYNRGLDRARGDIVIFSHDDIEIWQPQFATRLHRHIEHFDVVGIAGTSRLMAPWWSASGPPLIAGQIAHARPNGIEIAFLGGHRCATPGMQALDGVFLAFRRAAIERLRWDDQTFPGFHGYDIDCTFRAFRAGLTLASALDLPILHQSIGNLTSAWHEANQAFLKKHAAYFSPQPLRQHQWAIAQATTKEEAQQLMHYYYEALPE
jgi:hypothetical protein